MKIYADDVNITINHMEGKLLKYDWLIKKNLNSGQKVLDPDWLRRFILSIRTKHQKHTQ